MGYRDDFYTIDNIVGYTAADGDITQAPSVYFETNTEHGRITQVHSNQDNVGRNTVMHKELFVWQGNLCTLYEYSATNRDYRSKYRLHERYLDPEGLQWSRFSHPSRNQIVTNLTPQQKEILATVLATFTREKPKGNRYENVYIPMGDFAIFAA
jgi:hypothetical protein